MISSLNINTWFRLQFDKATPTTALRLFLKCDFRLIYSPFCDLFKYSLQDVCLVDMFWAPELKRRRRRAEDMTHISSLLASLTFPTWWYINTKSEPRVVEKSSGMQISRLLSPVQIASFTHWEVVKKRVEKGPLLHVPNERRDRDASRCSVGVLQGARRRLDWPPRSHVNNYSDIRAAEVVALNRNVGVKCPSVAGLLSLP